MDDMKNDCKGCIFCYNGICFAKKSERWCEEKEISNLIFNVEMNKEEVISKAIAYSKDKNLQRAYVAGFQSACNIVRAKMETCFNEEFCEEMEKLAQVSYMEIEEKI